MSGQSPPTNLRLKQLGYHLNNDRTNSASSTGFRPKSFRYNLNEIFETEGGQISRIDSNKRKQIESPESKINKDFSNSIESPSTIDNCVIASTIQENNPDNNTDDLEGKSRSFNLERKCSPIPKKRRSAVEENHKPDCGLPGEELFLSRKHARQLQLLMNVGKWEGNERKMLPLNANFGWHRWPFEHYFRSVKEDDHHGEITEYGIGIVLYFKLLKSLIVVFAIMSLLTLPSLILYGTADVITPVEKAFIATKPARLASVTIASFGEPNPSCRHVYENEKFVFQCPGLSSIRSIIAYYGQPRGSCVCPSSQLPDSGGNCPATLQNGQNCPISASTGSQVPCYLGTTRYNQKCCGYDSTLQSLQLNINTGCNSYTAPFILNHLCLHKTSCELNINATMPILLSNFQNDNINNININSSQICISSSIDPITNELNCITNLQHNSMFDGCDIHAKQSLLFEAICVDSISKVQSNIYYRDYIIQIASILNGFSLIIFVLGLFWIRKEQEKDIKKLQSLTCRASDYTLECTTAPFISLMKYKSDNTNVHKMYTNMSLAIMKFYEEILNSIPHIIEEGKIKVVDVNLTSTYYDYIEIACHRGSIASNIDRIINQFISIYRSKKLLHRSKSILYSYMKNDLRRQLYEFEIVNEKCNELQHEAVKHINRAFITFNTEEGKLRCLKAYRSNSFQEKINSDNRMGNKELIISKAADPSEIIWENFGYPSHFRILRIIGSTIGIIFILAVSYLLIFTVQYSATQLAPLTLTNGHCDTYSVNLNRNPTIMSNVDSNTITYTKVLWDHDPNYYNQSTNYGSNGFLECFCKQINYEQGALSAKNYKFHNIVNNQDEYWCLELFDSINYASNANFLTTFVIVAINVLIRVSLTYLVQFERLETSTDEVISYALKLFISQYINTALLSLLIYNNLSQLIANYQEYPILKSSSFSLGFFAGANGDFDYNWYASVGASLTFTMFLYTIGNFARSIMTLIMNWGAILWDQRSGNRYFWIPPLFSEQITHIGCQADLDYLYIGPEFPLEIVFGTLLAIIYVNMTYSATMPLMNLLTLLTLLLAFNVDKIFLLRFYRAPPVYSELLPRMITFALYGAALAHCSMGIWMFGNTLFYSPNLYTNIQYISTIYNNISTNFLVTTHSWTYQTLLIDRITNSNNLIILIIASIISIFLLYKFISFILMKCFDQQYNIFNDYFSHLVYFTSKQQVINEYSNPTYFEAIPYEVLKYRLESGVAHGNIAKMYKRRLEQLNESPDDVNIPEKEMLGLESYNLSFSVEYGIRFGLNTHHMRRTQPDDWLVSRSVGAERRKSILIKENETPITTPNEIRRASIVGSVTRQSIVDFTGIIGSNSNNSTLYANHEFVREIEHLIKECSPIRGDDDSWQPRRMSIINNESLNLQNFVLPTTSTPGRVNKVKVGRGNSGKRGVIRIASHGEGSGEEENDKNIHWDDANEEEENDKVAGEGSEDSEDKDEKVYALVDDIEYNPLEDFYGNNSFDV